MLRPITAAIAFLLCLGLSDTPASSPVSLDILPKAAYNSGRYQAAEFTYTIHLTEPGWFCHGWMYPILQWHEDEWPRRVSCRITDWKLIQERWGGFAWPLPYPGEYTGFAQLTTHNGTFIAKNTFRVLEGVPRQ